MSPAVPDSAGAAIIPPLPGWVPAALVVWVSLGQCFVSWSSCLCLRGSVPSMELSVACPSCMDRVSLCEELGPELCVCWRDGEMSSAVEAGWWWLDGTRLASLNVLPAVGSLLPSALLVLFPVASSVFIDPTAGSLALNPSSMPVYADGALMRRSTWAFQSAGELWSARSAEHG